jgi:hypothetical protein
LIGANSDEASQILILNQRSANGPACWVRAFSAPDLVAMDRRFLISQTAEHRAKVALLTKKASGSFSRTCAKGVVSFWEWIIRRP